jgi:Ca-activated chloride channel family protein
MCRHPASIAELPVPAQAVQERFMAHPARSPRPAWFVFWSVSAAAGLTLAAAPQSQFRSTARTVPVYVTVTGPDGRLVPDLTQDDFEVYDGGELQEITVFSNDVQPINVVLMLDRSGSVVANFRLVQLGAEEFVIRLLPEDQARIGSFSYRIQVDPREFTSDQQELLAILRNELQEAGPTPLWNAVDVAMTALLHQEGRRVVLVFTDGADAPARRGGTNISRNDVLERAREEDVMVYGIGLTGRGPGGGGRRGGRSRTTQEPDEGLIELAAESGGGYFAIRSADNLAETFARVAEELHHQYSIGFTPAKLDGKTHDLEVRLKQDGMTARARQSYVAPKSR